jgi:pimeloyl-ACP methyl ester carboxylesterase
MHELTHAQTENGIRFMAGCWPMNPDLPTVIFIHGANLSKLLWEEQVKDLSGRVNTIALDLPAHGQSHGPGHNTIAAYAGATWDFIEELNLPRPIPCGLSMGGAIVQHMLLNAPVPLDAAILVSTGARLKVMPLMLDAIRKDYQNYINGLAQFGTSPKSDPECITAVMAEAAQCLPETAIGDFEACNVFDVMGKLDAIQVPVLVITAEDDIITPPKYGSYLETHLGNASRVSIPDAGHLVPLEKSQAVSRAVGDFVNQVCP